MAPMPHAMIRNPYTIVPGVPHMQKMGLHCVVQWGSVCPARAMRTIFILAFPYSVPKFIMT